MSLLTILNAINYCLVLVYGLFLSAHIAEGKDLKQYRDPFLLLCPMFLLLQLFCYLCWGVDTTQLLYPLIVHLPLTLILIFMLKKKVLVSLVSVLTAYLCCQLPSWVSTMFLSLTKSALVGEISYTLSIAVSYILLRRFFVQASHDALSISRQTLFLFGGFPFLYYIFEYAILIGFDTLINNLGIFTELYSTTIIVLYIALLTAYHRQLQKRIKAELQKFSLEIGLKQSYAELDTLQHMETQTAIHRHNLRHHFATIDAFLDEGNVQDARNYIQQMQDDINSVSLKHFCENKLVNLLCSSFYNKAQAKGVRLAIDAKLPEKLSIPDVELCAVLSNGLENALHAVSELDDSLKWIELYCSVKLGKLLIEIKNPYVGEVTMKDGLPISNQKGHGYGCHSIRFVTEHNKGLCIFEAEQGMFTLRVALPVSYSAE